jgi:hypothetical protein
MTYHAEVGEGVSELAWHSREADLEDQEARENDQVPVWGVIYVM